MGRREKKKGLLFVVRHQGVCQKRKVGYAKNSVSGKPTKDWLPTRPCCSEETAPLFTELPSFCAYKSISKYIFLGGEKIATTECQISSQIHGVELRGKSASIVALFKDKNPRLQRSGPQIRNEVQKHRWHLPTSWVSLFARYWCLLCSVSFYHFKNNPCSFQIIWKIK